jgi:hypothetical protein
MIAFASVAARGRNFQPAVVAEAERVKVKSLLALPTRQQSASRRAKSPRVKMERPARIAERRLRGDRVKQP